MVAHLNHIGFTYTRFIDDVTITTKSQLGKAQLTIAVQEIHRLLNQNGFKAKRGTKEQVLNSQSIKNVLSIGIGGKTASHTKRQRNQLATEVINAAGKMAAMDTEAANNYMNSLLGKLNELKRLNPEAAKRLIALLR